MKIMVAFVRILILVSISIKLAIAVTNSHQVTTKKRYMVYILQDRKSKVVYEGWMCAGAIVHHRYILTSASCVYDGDKLWVVSGYEKYVSGEDMEKDPCIMKTRKRIVSMCHPKRYNLKKLYDNADHWNWFDIAIAKVDVPFNFFDMTYNVLCTYRPAPIRVNYVKKFEDAGREVITLGWGHREFYRAFDDPIDYNEKYLRYGSGLLTSQQECYKYVDGKWNNLFKSHVKRMFLCIHQPGHMDDKGILRNEDQVISINCNKSELDMSNEFNKLSSRSQNMSDCLALRAFNRFKVVSNRTTGGCCQNDHGGPLVTWIGGIETVIAVSTMSLISKIRKCRTPYFYTSTHCFGAAIACFLEPEVGNSRRAMFCNKIMNKEVAHKKMWPDVDPLPDFGNDSLDDLE